MNRRLLYTALGDSLTVGIGSTLFHPNFVKYYHESLEFYFRQPIERAVVARNGATTDDILARLSDPDIVQLIRNSTFITLTGGGNDLLHAGKIWLRTGDEAQIARSIQHTLENMTRMVNTILQLHDGRDQQLLIRVLNLYNPLFRVPGSRQWIESYNLRLLTLEERSSSVRVADIYHAFDGYEPLLLSIDRTHPNPEGYRVMASTVANLGFYPADTAMR